MRHPRAIPYGVLSKGLKAHWRFDETSGSNALDSSGNGYDGTLYGTYAHDTSDKMVGASCIDFQASGAYMSSPLIWTPTEFSVAFWIKPGSVSTSYSDFIGDGWGTFEFLSDSSGNVWCGLSVTDRFTSTDLPAGTISTGNWQQITFTYDNGSAKFYKNSILLVSDTGWVNTGAWSKFDIGTNGGNTVDGRIDDCRIYSRCLSLRDIQILYQYR